MTKPESTKAAPVKAAPKTPNEYLNGEPTANQEAFLSWIYVETGIKPKNATEKKMFELGVRAAGLYSRYQASKRPAK